MSVKQFEIKGLKEKRSKIKAEVVKLREKITSEERALTTEEKAAFEKLKADFVAIGDQIAAAQADFDAILSVEDADPEPAPGDGGRSRRSGGIAGGFGGRPPKGGDAPGMAPNDGDRSHAFRAWARAQHDLPPTREQREACRRLRLDPKSKFFVFRLNKGPKKQRAMGVGTGAAGGYFVPQGFAGAFDLALQSTDGTRQVATILRTDTGNTVPYPTVDDTSVTGEQIGENAEGNAADVTAGVVNLGAYKFSSKVVLVSAELMQDSAFDVESMVGNLGGERLARIQGARFTTGNGTTTCQGIVTGASAGVTAASATAIDPDELVRLYYAVDPAYRNSPSFGFMMHDGIRLQVALMKDGEGRPLFQASYRDGEPDLIFGRPVTANQFMQSTVATGTTTVLAGDFSKFLIRDAAEVRMKRLDERYAEKDQTGFIMLMRSDSKVLNSAAIKKLTQA